MSFLRSNLSAILSRLWPRPAEAAEVSIKIANLTRQTQLADRVQLAGDGPHRRKGLLGRDQLPGGEGLWIVPCEAIHTFWMRFPIDLVYLDRKQRIVKTRSHVAPWRLSACLRAHSVIELPAGTVGETKTMRGDQLTFVYQASPGAGSRGGFRV